MTADHKEIQSALRARRVLPSPERMAFPEPEVLSRSKGCLVHWVAGVVIQDYPALILMAAGSLAYSALLGFLTLIG